MKRRRYLFFTAPILSTISGCFAVDDSSGTGGVGGGSTTKKELNPVNVSADEVESAEPYASLHIAYAATVSSEIPSDPPTLAEERMKWLFVKMRVTNTGSSEHEFTGGPFIIRAKSEVYGIVSTREGWELRGRSIEPDATETGWIVFQIPSGVTEATLTIRDDISRNYSIRFVREASLDTTVPE